MFNLQESNPGDWAELYGAATRGLDYVYDLDRQPSDGKGRFTFAPEFWDFLIAKQPRHRVFRPVADPTPRQPMRLQNIPTRPTRLTVQRHGLHFRGQACENETQKIGT